MRIALVGVLVLGVAVFILLIELGVNAGLIHHGVSVQGINLGGMTAANAGKLLEKEGDTLKKTLVVFGRDGLPRKLSFEPRTIGWQPRWKRTLRAAMAVGRDQGPFDALVERGRAWFGIEVPWAGSPKPEEVDRLLTEWEEIAEASGLTIDRGALRYKIRRVLSYRPRQSLYRVPLTGD